MKHPHNLSSNRKMQTFGLLGHLKLGRMRAKPLLQGTLTPSLPRLQGAPNLHNTRPFQLQRWGQTHVYTSFSASSEPLSRGLSEAGEAETGAQQQSPPHPASSNGQQHLPLSILLGTRLVFLAGTRFGQGGFQKAQPHRCEHLPTARMQSKVPHVSRKSPGARSTCAFAYGPGSPRSAFIAPLTHPETAPQPRAGAAGAGAAPADASSPVQQRHGAVGPASHWDWAGFAPKPKQWAKFRPQPIEDHVENQNNKIYFFLFLFFFTLSYKCFSFPYLCNFSPRCSFAPFPQMLLSEYKSGGKILN